MVRFDIFGVVFFTVQLPVLHAKRYNLVPFPIIFILLFSLQVGPGSDKRKLNKTAVVVNLLLYVNKHGNS